MTLNLETIAAGSKIYKQAALEEIFESMRTWVGERNEVLMSVSDEELFQLLIWSVSGSVNNYTIFGSRLSKIKKQYQTKGPPPLAETFEYLQNEILNDHPPLRSYLESLPKLIRGVTQRPIQTYEAYTQEYKPATGANTQTISNSS